MKGTCTLKIIHEITGIKVGLKLYLIWFNRFYTTNRGLYDCYPSSCFNLTNFISSQHYAVKSFERLN